MPTSLDLLDVVYGLLLWDADPTAGAEWLSCADERDMHALRMLSAMKPQTGLHPVSVWPFPTMPEARTCAVGLVGLLSRDSTRAVAQVFKMERGGPVTLVSTFVRGTD